MRNASVFLLAALALAGCKSPTNINHVGNDDLRKKEPIVFTDSVFKQYILDVPGNDANGDGEISYEEAENIFELKFSRSDANDGNPIINDVSELKHFTNVTVVELDYHDIASIDLSALAKLQRFAACDMRALADLTVGSKPDLTYFNISSFNIFYDSSLSNQLTMLDLSRAPKLEILDLDYNLHLASVEMGAKPALTWLSMVKLGPDSPLKLLDLSQAPNLEHLDINGSSALASLGTDFANHTKLTYFKASGAQELGPALNFAKSPGLDEAWISNVKALQTLYVSQDQYDNQIQTKKWTLKEGANDTFAVEIAGS